MRSLPLHLLLVAATALLLYLGSGAYRYETLNITISKELSAQKGTDAIMTQKLEQLLETLSLGTLGNYSKTQEIQKALQNRANIAHHTSLRFLYYFYAALFLTTLIFYLTDRDLMILFLGIGSLLSLLFGLISPLLMMVVYKALPILGEVTLSFESKSIVTTITKLFSDHNYLLALIILLFSVIVPVMKSLLIILYGFLREHKMSEKIVRWIEKIGKWSMIDVFIVALLVVLFSTKQDIHTAMVVEVGFYFFLGYVLLSMIGSGLLSGPLTKRET